MKKYLFLAVAATAMMASCSNDEVVEMASQQGKAIAFENAFVNNSTRAALVAGYNSTTLPADIDVYGSLNNGTSTTWIFDDVTLTKENNWVYSPLQYWVKGNDYKFYALAPANKVTNLEKNDNLFKSFRFENDGATDLLYAYVDRSGNNYAETPVAFTLNHLLSKVKFSMTNGFASDQATIKVTNIAINEITKAAIYTVSEAKGEWSSSDATGFSVNFGNIVEAGTETGAEALAVKVGETKESNYERFLIPEINTGFNVTFTAELLNNGVTVGTYNLETNLTNIVLEQGKSYNFIATLTEKNITGDPDAGLQPITFTVAVSNWEAGNGWDVTASEGAGAATDDGTYNGGEIVTGSTTTSGN